MSLNLTTEVAKLMATIPVQHRAAVDKIIGLTFQAAQHDLQQTLAESVMARLSRTTHKEALDGSHR